MAFKRGSCKHHSRGNICGAVRCRVKCYGHKRGCESFAPGWTTTKPSSAGFYWYKPNGCTPIVVFHCADTVDFTGSEESMRLDEFKDCEWLGPIKPLE